MSGDPNLAKSMCMAVWMLANAVPTVEAGRHDRTDRYTWAEALDKLSLELRGGAQSVDVKEEVGS